jgi:hypothetical protein
MYAGKNDEQPPEEHGEPPTSNRRGNPYKHGTKLAIQWELEYWIKGIERTRDWLKQNTRNDEF